MSITQIEHFMQIQQQKFEALYHEMSNTISKLITHKTPTALFSPEELLHLVREVQDHYDYKLQTALHQVRTIVSPVQRTPGYTFEVFSLIHAVERPKTIYFAQPIPIELDNGTVVVKQLCPSYFVQEPHHLHYKPLTPVDYALRKEQPCRLDAMSAQIAADKCSAPYLMNQHIELDTYIKECPVAHVVAPDSYYFRPFHGTIVFSLPEDKRTARIHCPQDRDGRLVYLNKTGYVSLTPGCDIAFPGSGYYYSAPVATDTVLLEQAYDMVMSGNSNDDISAANEVLEDLSTYFSNWFNIVKEVPGQFASSLANFFYDESVEIRNISHMAQAGTDPRVRQIRCVDSGSIEELRKFYPQRTSSPLGEEVCGDSHPFLPLHRAEEWLLG